MKVFDCFTFFNELDLLEFRLKYLDSVVDYFVICESNITFSGKNKAYNLENEMKRFSKWKNKIIYLPIEQSTEGLIFENVDKYTPTDGSWFIESQQRAALSYINDMIEENDLVILGDVDEIPNTDIINKLREIPEGQIVEPIVLSQLFHYYYMNCQNEGFERQWNGSIVSTGKDFKYYNPQGLRDNRNLFRYKILDAGWHFSYLGGVEKIRTKIQSFSHREYDRPDILSEDNIVEALEKGKDVLKRPGVFYKFYPLEYYPEDLRKLMEEYPIFIKKV